MKLMAIFAIAAVALAGCVSTQMKGFIGAPVQEAEIRYGPPINIIDMSDGSKAFQFRFGGGAAMIPTRATTNAYLSGPNYTATTVLSPGGLVELPGCVLTFIAKPESGSWVIRDTRVPKRLTC